MTIEDLTKEILVKGIAGELDEEDKYIEQFAHKYFDGSYSKKQVRVWEIDEEFKEHWILGAFDFERKYERAKCLRKLMDGFPDEWEKDDDWKKPFKLLKPYFEERVLRLVKEMISTSKEMPRMEGVKKLIEEHGWFYKSLKTLI